MEAGRRFDFMRIYDQSKALRASNRRSGETCGWKAVQRAVRRRRLQCLNYRASHHSSFEAADWLFRGLWLQTGLSNEVDWALPN
jgi:hypothetical protein